MPLYVDRPGCTVLAYRLVRCICKMQKIFSQRLRLCELKMIHCPILDDICAFTIPRLHHSVMRMARIQLYMVCFRYGALQHSWRNNEFATLTKCCPVRRNAIALLMASQSNHHVGNRGYCTPQLAVRRLPYIWPTKIFTKFSMFSDPVRYCIIMVASRPEARITLGLTAIPLMV